MKCPYCGNELDTGFNCPKCKAKSYKEIVSEYNTNGEKIYEKNTIKLVQPKPTTAEMWEWLGRNFSVTFLHRDGENDYLEFAHGFWNYISEENGFDACVRAAYAEARKQEVTK